MRIEGLKDWVRVRVRGGMTGAEHGGPPPFFGEATIPVPTRPREWDRELYRTSLDYLLAKAIIGKCPKCQGTLKKDGIAVSSYRLKCGKCNATTGGSAYNEAIEEHFEEIIAARPEARVYARKGPRRQEPVLKIGQRQLPAMKRKTVTKAEESDEEDKEIVRSENLIEILRRLKEVESANKEKDEIIIELRQEIDSLKKIIQKEDTKIEVGPKAEPDPKVGETDGSGAKGLKKDLEAKAKAPATAWQGPKPDWVTIGQKGKPAKIKGKPKNEEVKKK
jgi:ribosomal protein S27AE